MAGICRASPRTDRKAQGWSMTDRELLELAAKAAGIKHVDYTGIDYDGRHGFELVGEYGRHIGTWNPLQDDGDALRLAVTLGLDLELHGLNATMPYCAAVYDCSRGLAIEQEFTGDIMSTARLAIVRAAAEIGKNL